MNESEIMECLTQIQQVCLQLVAGELTAKQQGRMPTVLEARHMDHLSQELMTQLHKLPANLGEAGLSYGQRVHAEAIFAQVKDALKNIVHPNPSFQRSTGSMPKAVSSRIAAYMAYV